MTPEQADFVARLFLAQIQNEQKTTRRVIAAVPDGKGDYRPHPVSRNALDLAWHIAASEKWFLDSIARGEFPAIEEEKRPADVKEPSDVAAWYDREFATNFDRVAKLTKEQFAKPIPFYGLYNHPGVLYLPFMIHHSVHHRGQLAAYLRPMGAKVPNIYGGSYDEPLQMSARD